MTTFPNRTLEAMAIGLSEGVFTARFLVEETLDRIATSDPETRLAFMSVASQRALAEADRIDLLRNQGRAPSRFAGIPFAVKDLFDVAGEVTTAGSKVLQQEAAKTQDSGAVARLRAQGFIPIGRTVMTEFAYSGLGLNPHYGTPPSVFDRVNKRIPGGSSSGTAVAIAAGLVSFGLGTDTGGSCRIPAAFNGITGYKPTARRVSKDGVFPLSASLDSVGPLATSVECCGQIDSILSGDWNGSIAKRAVNGLNLAVLDTMVLEGLDSVVALAFEQVLQALSRAGAKITRLAFPDLARLPEYLQNGGIVAAEAWALHGDQLKTQAERFDPRVAARMRFGANTTPEALAQFHAGRDRMIDAFKRLAAGYDAVLCPTVPILPPKISDLEDEAAYRSLNGQCLRNTYVFNFTDSCSISIPLKVNAKHSVGLMLSLPAQFDQSLFATALAVESMT